MLAKGFNKHALRFRSQVFFFSPTSTKVIITDNREFNTNWCTLSPKPRFGGFVYKNAGKSIWKLPNEIF